MTRLTARPVLGSVDARCVSDSFQCSNCLARLNMAECERVSAADDDIFREEMSSDSEMIDAAAADLTQHHHRETHGG